jgi:ubiquitin-conjugating enzyme E2 Q
LLDPENYPDISSFLIFTDNEDVPAHLLQALTDTANISAGWRVPRLLSYITNVIMKVLGSPQVPTEASVHVQACAPTIDPDASDEEGDESDESDICYGDSELDSDDDDLADQVFGINATSAAISITGQASSMENVSEYIRKLISRDLRTAKLAGFRVGILGGRKTFSIISMSVRASRLGFSDQALQAWNMNRSDYVVLLYRLTGTYRTLLEITNLPLTHCAMSFVIGKCNRYKPTLGDAVAAFDRFQTQKEIASTSESPVPVQHNEEYSFTDTLVSKSLNQFMNDSFLSLVRQRWAKSTSWDNANMMLLFLRGLSEGAPGSSMPAVFPTDDAEPTNAEQEEKSLPSLLRADHLTDETELAQKSILLLAAQFAVRYFGLSARYCLVCHRRTGRELEALRPYVCSRPLCLFQYLSLGFGPSIEHEILTQPKVVDLLVSFCYSSLDPKPYAAATRHIPQLTAATLVSHRIREFPMGLRLKVPNLSAPTDKRSVHGNFNPTDLSFTAMEAPVGLTLGQWVAIRAHGAVQPRLTSQVQVFPDAAPQASIYHGKVLQIINRTLYLEYVSESVLFTQPAVYHDGRDYLFPYCHDLDDLDDCSKAVIMKQILDVGLPSITSIREFLEDHPHMNLKCMPKVSPAAATLLEWIVASNRSCLLQTDELLPSATKGASSFSPWTMFRFAQGSPDKELRFNRALQDTGKIADQHPTIFAWHGSALGNWHSIVRTGLDYNDIGNGRAFGNGVYFSPHFATSTAFSGISGVNCCWRGSELRVVNAMSLNEIVNAPERFQSRSPHYVVANNDWHQCRFLFVQTYTPAPGSSSHITTLPLSSTPVMQLPSTGPGGSTARLAAPRHVPAPPTVTSIPLQTFDISSSASGVLRKRSTQASGVDVQFFPQDPDRQAFGPDNTPVRIPLSLMPHSPFLAFGKSKNVATADLGIDSSSDEDPEDIDFLFPLETDDPQVDMTRKRKAEKMASSSIESLGTAAASNMYTSFQQLYCI